MNPHILSFVTDFGDTAVTLPLAAIFSSALWWVQSPSAGVAVFRSLAICLTAMAFLKVAFITCGQGWDAGLVSPSGHAALALTVYGILAMVLGSWVSGWWRPLLAVAVALLVSAIAISRVLLQAHTVPEVVVGVLVGVAALVVFAVTYRWGERPYVGRANLLLVTLALAIPLFVLHGERLPAEQIVRRVAHMLRTDVGVCGTPRGRSEIADRPLSLTPRT